MVSEPRSPASLGGLAVKESGDSADELLHPTPSLSLRYKRGRGGRSEADAGGECGKRRHVTALSTVTKRDLGGRKSGK